MGEVSLEFIVELLKQLNTRMDAMDARMDRVEARLDAMERVIIATQRDLVELKADVRALTQDNLSFRGYLDSLTRDSFRNVSMIDRTGADMLEFRGRLERVEARPEHVD